MDVGAHFAKGKAPARRSTPWVLKSFRELAFKTHPDQIGMVRVGEIRQILDHIEKLEKELADERRKRA